MKHNIKKAHKTIFKSEQDDGKNHGQSLRGGESTQQIFVFHWRTWFEFTYSNRNKSV